MLWHGRHLLVSSLRKVRWAADQADEILGIAKSRSPIVAVHGTTVPWGNVQATGSPSSLARQVPDLLQALLPVLGPERVAWLADQARLRFHAAGPSDPRRPGALLSSDDYGSSVERAATLHPYASECGLAL